ncbi:mediator of RNA polymerase II transcription subunit 15-like [Rhagoletis pomonella]|uniref:mediator of RNA polymerase II transcription subunit 15-like n=1 Tax=Rhagoletis pomonella TaxID=28610 RepID=UPI00178248C2|nr:mediator of RNA polymerase II transcription subunit 15-like [Rhagoletis pomonella]
MSLNRTPPKGGGQESSQPQQQQHRQQRSQQQQESQLPLQPETPQKSQTQQEKQQQQPEKHEQKQQQQLSISRRSPNSWSSQCPTSANSKNPNIQDQIELLQKQLQLLYQQQASNDEPTPGPMDHSRTQKTAPRKLSNTTETNSSSVVIKSIITSISHEKTNGETETTKTTKHQHNPTPYSNVLKLQRSNFSTSQNNSANEDNPLVPIAPRRITTYDDITPGDIMHDEDTQVGTACESASAIERPGENPTGSKTLIYPKNISNRQKSQLKSITKNRTKKTEPLDNAHA